MPKILHNSKSQAAVFLIGAAMIMVLGLLYFAYQKQAAEKKTDKTTVIKKIGNLEVLDRDYRIAYDFAEEVMKKFKSVVKSIILFGSVAKREATPASDIDIVIIVDDASIKWDREAIAWYQEELKKIVSKKDEKERLHINTVTLSSFWENILVGEPASINILRYGIPILDPGFIMPLKFLLYQGRIRPSQEAVYNCAGRVPWHMFRGKIKILGAIGDFYWAELLEKVFVANKKLDKQYVDWYREMYSLAHSIKNNETSNLPGRAYDLWLKRSEEFTNMMMKLLESEKPANSYHKIKD